MSDSDRSEFVALVAVVCTALVFVIGLAAGGYFGPRQTFNQPVGQPQAPATEYYQEQRGPSEAYLWPEFSTRDTYAQWAMTVLALVATATGILGVVWIRQTLQATRDTAQAAFAANSTAREIGEAQVRAYLSCHSVTYTFDDFGLWIRVKIINFGNSPAKWSMLRAQAMLNNPFYTRDKDGQRLIRTEVYDTVSGAIAAGNTEPEELLILWSHVDLGTDVHAAFLGNKNTHFSIDCALEWMDVFDKIQPALRFFCTSTGPSILAGEGRGRTRAGTLRVYNSASEANHYAEQRRRANQG